MGAKEVFSVREISWWRGTSESCFYINYAHHLFLQSVFAPCVIVKPQQSSWFSHARWANTKMKYEFYVDTISWSIISICMTGIVGSPIYASIHERMYSWILNFHPSSLTHTARETARQSIMIDAEHGCGENMWHGNELHVFARALFRNFRNCFDS